MSTFKNPVLSLFPYVKLSLAAAALLSIACGSAAHAQATPGLDGSAPAVSTSSATIADAPDAGVGGQDPVQPVVARRGWGIDYRQEVTPGKGYLHTHGFDLAGSGTGRFQNDVTRQSPALAGSTQGVGFLANIREHPTSWFGLELNYGYNKYSEHYNSRVTGVGRTNLQIGQHEATAGYVFHIRTPYVQPFIVLGGGGVNFRGTESNPQIGNQWRGAAMYEVGLDFVSKRQPHVGFRVQEHGLFYKAPDFYVANLRSNSWVHQAAPSVGVFYRF